MEAERELREAREALLAAVNAKDLEGIEKYIHPTYTGRAAGDVQVDYAAMMNAIKGLFRIGKVQETVEIEKLDLDGDTARLTTTRTDSVTALVFFKQRSTTRQVETWQRFDGRWMMTGETQV